MDKIGAIEGKVSPGSREDLQQKAQGVKIFHSQWQVGWLICWLICWLLLRVALKCLLHLRADMRSINC